MPEERHTLTTKLYIGLLCSVIFTELSFYLTATPLMFALREFACEDYYIDHDYSGEGDRCRVPGVNAQFASYTALYTMVNRLVGMMALFLANYWTKTHGLKFTIINQTMWPGIRTIIQVLALRLHGRTGATIMILSYITNIFGCSAAYFLTLFNLIAELSGGSGNQTSYYGQIGGVSMIAISFGMTGGSWLHEHVGLDAPFKAEAAALLVATLINVLLIPKIPLKLPEIAEGQEDNEISLSRMQRLKSVIYKWFEPLRFFAPQKMLYENGKEKMYWGMLVFALGSFLNIVGSGYTTTMLQITAIAKYGFSSSNVSYLMSAVLMMSALNVSIIFPNVLKFGRRVLSSSRSMPTPSPPSEETSALLQAPTGGVPVYGAMQEEENIEVTPTPVDKPHGALFDLWYFRGEIAYSAIITALMGLCSKDWQIYVVGVLLAFAGAAMPLSKGIVLELVMPHQRSDALSAIFLLDQLGALLGSNIFGFLFAHFSKSGISDATFFVSAAATFIAAIILLAVRFPPSTSITAS